MDRKTVKQNIQKVRKGLGYTQQEMAEKLGISRTAYRNLEKGETKVYSDHISKMAEISGKAEEEVVLGYDPAREGELKLLEIANYEERLRTIKNDYEKRIEILNDKIKSQQDLIESLQSNVKVLRSMVDLLKR